MRILRVVVFVAAVILPFGVAAPAVGATSLPVIVAIGAGGDHSCAVTSEGGAKCWGRNGSGELGDGTRSNSPLPVDVLGLESGVAAIAPGTYGTCALAKAGGVMCWGRFPVDTPGLTSGATAIASGRLHRCALTSGGGVKCWGSNSAGQLGNGTRTFSNVPVDVSSLGSGVTAIAAGDGQSCALTNGGGVSCWGANTFGQLGNGTTVDSTVPVDVWGLASGVRAITAGGLHTCAITAGGEVKCWGRNVAGELGDGTTVDSTVPVDVEGLAGGVTAITAGVLHTCAVTGAGGVRCWGNNVYGRLGNGLETPGSTVPGDVVGLAQGIIDVAAGDGHTCALTSEGGVKCWGLNYAGQLGNGTSIHSNKPVVVDFAPHPRILNRSAVGLTHGGPFSASTKLTPHGTSITWQAQALPPVLPGERIRVWMATKDGGRWSSFSPFSTVVVDEEGYAYFSFRSPIAQWVSIRFTFAGNASFPPVTSLARPARYT